MNISNNSSLFIDLESNSLKISKETTIFCVCTSDGEFVNNYKGLQELLDSYKFIVGHNILSFDIPLLKEVLGIKIPLNKIVDTLLMSRLIIPDREGGHSLKNWGKQVNLFKGDYNDFTQFTPEMLEYCRNDVEVTKLVYQKLLREKERYNVSDRSIEIEHKFAAIINRQIENGFHFNIEKGSQLHERLNQESEVLYEILINEMPKKRLDSETYKKALQEGRVLNENESTYTYSDRKGKVVTKDIRYELPNPTSRQQVAQHLIDSYGWKPRIFTETNLPKISEAILEPLPYEFSKKCARLFRVQKQMGMLKDGENGWLKLVTEEGKLHGYVNTNGTNTGRCSHSKPNVAQADSDPEMRALFEPKPGWVLVGTDASGLELRILSHYLHRYDGGVLADEVVNGDIHTYNQNVMGLQERNSAKTAIYALIYGAGNEKLGKIKALDRHTDTTNSFKLKSEGGHLRAEIEDNFIGYKQLLEDVKHTYQARGYLVGIDGRPLHPRKEYSALNLLIQSAGAIVMKQALINSLRLIKDKGFRLKQDFNYVANVHDEIQIEARPEITKDIGESVVEAIRTAGVDLGVKCKLDGEYKIGLSWAETH